MNKEEAMKVLGYQLNMKDTDVYTPINYEAIETVLNYIDTMQNVIDEMYAEINKLKTNSIPTSVIQKKIEEVNNSNGYSPVNKIFIEKVLNEILEEGRNNK